MRALLKKLILWALDGEFDRPALVEVSAEPVALDALAASLK